MSDGFRNTAPMGSVLIRGSNLSTNASLPLNAFTGDVSAFAALELAIFATGSAGGTAGLLQLQLLWLDDITTQNLIWVDTVEVNFDTVSGFAAKRAFVRTPVRSGFLQIVSNTGTVPPTAPTVRIDAYGLTTPVPRLIAWNDQDQFTGTDLIVLKASGGVIAPLTTVGPFNGGLHSGPCVVVFNVAFQTGGTVGQARVRTGFGSSGVGFPDLYVNQPAAGSSLAVSMTFSGLLPRRPISALVTNTFGVGANQVNTWNLAIYRDEP